MRTSLHRALVGFIALFVTFPAVVPSETSARKLSVVSDAACNIADALPSRIAALPRFSDAVDNRKRVRIVAIGSSSTEGVGASSPLANYPSQLRALLQLALPDDRFEVINLGIGGETAEKTVTRLRRDIPRLSPDLVVWQVGTNDALNGVAIPDYEKTVRGALQFLKAGHYDTVLIGMQWTRKLAGAVNYVATRDATTRVAGLEGVTIVSRYDAMRKLADASGREDFTGPDHLHMNDRGYRCLAEEVAVTLAQAVTAEHVQHARVQQTQGDAEVLAHDHI
jgi:lysophospholipase L1-like esterase